MRGHVQPWAIMTHDRARSPVPESEFALVTFMLLAHHGLFTHHDLVARRLPRIHIAGPAT
jgi:hypothetical protein